MTNLPKIECYGKYSNGNYGLNCLVIRTATIDLYFSYQTIIAYHDFVDGLVCCENVWGPTTGKHLNWINPIHDVRKSKTEFDRMLANACERHNI